MKTICFIYTDTNGLHKCNNYPTTKTLYKYARLIAMHYMICNYENGKFIEKIRKDIILKPNTINFDPIAKKFHNISMEEAHNKGVNNITAISELKTDLSDVDIIVSHSLPFHIKALQVECFRTAIDINFSKYILIDTMSFGHNLDYPKFSDMVIKYKINNKKSQLDQYKDLFLVLYDLYSKNINKVESKDECEFIDD